MKFHFVFNDKCASISLRAETAEESCQLVKLGLNANADTRKLTDVYASDNTIVAWITLPTRKDRSVASICPPK